MKVFFVFHVTLSEVIPCLLHISKCNIVLLIGKIKHKMGGYIAQ